MEIRKLREQGKQMVLLEQKIKIIQRREKLDMQMRAGFEFTNMCRVKSEKPKARNFFFHFGRCLERRKLTDNGVKRHFLMNMLIPAREHIFLTFFCLLARFFEQPQSKAQT